MIPEFGVRPGSYKQGQKSAKDSSNQIVGEEGIVIILAVDPISGKEKDDSQRQERRHEDDDFVDNLRVRVLEEQQQGRERRERGRR